MAETQQTMTEFTFAPGEKNIIGDRFSPSDFIYGVAHHGDAVQGFFINGVEDLSRFGFV